MPASGANGERGRGQRARQGPGPGFTFLDQAGVHMSKRIRALLVAAFAIFSAGTAQAAINCIAPPVLVAPLSYTDKCPGESGFPIGCEGGRQRRLHQASDNQEVLGFPDGDRRKKRPDYRRPFRPGRCVFSDDHHTEPDLGSDRALRDHLHRWREHRRQWQDGGCHPDVQLQGQLRPAERKRARDQRRHCSRSEWRAAGKPDHAERNRHHGITGVVRPVPAQHRPWHAQTHAGPRPVCL